MQSAYFGSISMSRALRLRRSHAINVLPDPPKRSATTSPALLLFKRARSTSSTGFAVGWMRFAAGFFSSQRVDCDLSPYQASYSPVTCAYKIGSCWNLYRPKPHAKVFFDHMSWQRTWNPAASSAF